MQNIYNEIKRKAIHLASLWTAFLVYFTDKYFYVGIFAICFLGMILFEIARKHESKIGDFVRQIFAPILRDFESSKTFVMTGATYMMLSFLICAIFFNKLILLSAISILIISDTFAALIGMKWGVKNKFGKSNLGSLVFFISSLLCLFSVFYLTYGTEFFYFPKIIFAKIIIIALAATLVELISKNIKLDDNLTIPLCVGFVMSVL